VKDVERFLARSTDKDMKMAALLASEFGEKALPD
jgi:hypothetical protein